MMDFLKAYPFITMEQYYWGLSYPMVRLMGQDATKVYYLSEKQAKEVKIKQAKKRDGVYENPMDFAAALGIPIINE